jgi:hypothetical protein
MSGRSAMGHGTAYRSGRASVIHRLEPQTLTYETAHQLARQQSDAGRLAVGLGNGVSPSPTFAPSSPT